MAPLALSSPFRLVPHSLRLASVILQRPFPFTSALLVPQDDGDQLPEVSKTPMRVPLKVCPGTPVPWR